MKKPTSGHLAQPLTFVKTFAADVREEEKEKQEEDSENDSIEPEVKGNEMKDMEEVGMEEVTVVKEVKREMRKVEMADEGAIRKKKKKRTGRAGGHMGSMDRRGIEVKATIKT